MTKKGMIGAENAPHTTTKPRRPCNRDEVPFSWHVSCGMPVYAALAGVRFDRIFRDFDAIVEAFTVGEPRARERFGSDVRYDGPTWAGISYGHANGLGAQLTFPEDSEVGHTPIYRSLSEGVAALQQEVDWANAGLMPFYLDLWEQLKRAFPDRHIAFGGFGAEGPITTAWELRGHGFFLDLYDNPELCKVFLRLVTDSIVDYNTFVRSVNGQPAFVETGIGLCDDVSAMLHPDPSGLSPSGRSLWPDMVLPFQEQFFRTQTSGRRHAHIEDLTPDHLPYLDDLGLDRFDPSVSPGLKASDLRDRCHVPFLWRLNSMQVRDFSRDQIRCYVFEGVADGASGVFCVIARTMITSEDVTKVHTFIDAAKQVEQLLADGCPRHRLCEHLTTKYTKYTK